MCGKAGRKGRWEGRKGQMKQKAGKVEGRGKVWWQCMCKRGNLGREVCVVWGRCVCKWGKEEEGENQILQRREEVFSSVGSRNCKVVR